MSGRKTQKRSIHRSTVWQQLTQSPARFLWGIGIMTGIFLVLGVLLRFFWWTEPQTIPFIEGCQGPLRVRPASVKDKTPSHKIYGDLSLQTPEKSIESLLPPEEQPSLPHERMSLPLQSPETQTASPREQKKQQQSPGLEATTTRPSKKPLPSLDDLLQQMDEVVASKTPPPQNNTSPEKKRVSR